MTVKDKKQIVAAYLGSKYKTPKQIAKEFSFPYPEVLDLILRIPKNLTSSAYSGMTVETFLPGESDL